MNILFCLDSTFSRRNGGIATVSLTLKKSFETRGHTCFLLSARNNQEDADECQYYLPFSTTCIRNGENRIWFRNFIKEKNIDVIINQNGCTPNSLWPLVWSEDLSIRRLTIYHSDFNSLWSCHKKFLIDNVFVRSFHLLSLINYIWKSLFRLKYKNKLCTQYRLSDKLVFLSNNLFSSFEWFSGIKKDNRFDAIPNPIEDIFNVNIENIQKENIVLFVGRLSPEKRVDYLLKVWKIICDHHLDWSLYVVGDGSMREEYEVIVKTLQLRNVHFEGYNAPLNYYKRSKIFCLTSATEGFGLVLVEAMSCGVIPIAFNSYASVTDIIDNGKCGYLISPFDIETYANRLLLLMDNESLRQKMALKAKDKSSKFLLANIVDRWEKLFY